MILSDRDIARELASDRLVIEGHRGIGPASVDVYLGTTLHDGGWCFQIEDDWGYVLLPGKFILGTTAERVELPDDIMAQVHGCSSIGRQGLFVQNAGLIDPGFHGTITLELFNASDISYKLKPGDRIAQLSFQYLFSPAKNPYKGRYQNQRGATAARPQRESK